ncbi:Suppressor of the cold-sensitive snRNP bioproteinsis mutant brr1-1 [Perkinsus olseni]|uniref:subtilisin n=1 Tax=Perkinsus olseni TaxID=32597 RepID=A0A7J6LRT0_PEROL|nr:Suppressor of the cold-sensitive snRNP bioproteinsis mutant brr1-1 [Perkinsus olseni]
MLLLLCLVSVLLVASQADIADDRTVLSISRASSSAPSASLQSASITSMVDVRSIPNMLSDSLGTRRQLTSSETTVADCLSNELAIESMFTVGVQVIDTASVNCRATRQEVCQYLEDAAEALDVDVICEPNYVVKLEKTVPATISGLRASITGLGVNDKFASRQWNLELIGMKEAWKAVESRPTREVVVAVVDSGVDYRHEDLNENIFSDEKCSHGYNFYDDNDDANDVNGHGTHCAGILGAEIDNGVGVAGIARVKIMSLRVFGPDGVGDVRLALRALNYALENGADLSSHSYGSSDASSTFRFAIARAAQQGHLVVAAAGNEGRDISVDKVYPCAFTEQVDMLCVASSGKTFDDRLASHSNYAPFVDIAAPGEEIPSTYPNDEYVYMTGTSMATPHVTGVAALLYALGLSGDDARSSLLASVDVLSNRFGSDINYFGRLNSAKAVEVALTKPTIAPRERRSIGSDDCVLKSSATGLLGSSFAVVLLCFLSYIQL